MMLQARRSSLSVARIALSPAREDRRQLLRRDDLELRERAILRLLVGAASGETARCGGSACPACDRTRPRPPARGAAAPTKILALAPAARSRPAGAATRPRPMRIGPLSPRMTVERVLAIGRRETPPARGASRREARADADVLRGCPRRRRGRAAASRPPCLRRPCASESRRRRNRSRARASPSASRACSARRCLLAGFAITPSSPAPSKRRNQSAATVAVARRRREVQRRLRAGEHDFERWRAARRTVRSRRSRSPSQSRSKNTTDAGISLGKQLHARRRRDGGAAAAPRSRARRLARSRSRRRARSAAGSCAFSGSTSSGK